MAQEVAGGVAPEGDPQLVPVWSEDPTEGDWRVEYCQGAGVPGAEEVVADYVPGVPDVEDYVPGRDNPEVDPDAGSWAASYISTLHVSLPETSEQERYVACAMCAEKQAKKGDLCRDCWRWTRTVDEAL